MQEARCRGQGTKNFLLSLTPASCILLATKFIKDVECQFAFENDTLKLTLTKIFCDDSTETENCTVPIFDCEEA